MILNLNQKTNMLRMFRRLAFLVFIISSSACVQSQTETPTVTTTREQTGEGEAINNLTETYTSPTPTSVIIVAPTTAATAVSLPTVSQWGIFELELATGHRYTDAEKFQDVTLAATFAGPEGMNYRIPGFWDGGDIWRIRFAPPQAGKWMYIVDSSDSDLDAATNDGVFLAEPVTEAQIASNPNWRGFLRVSDNGRYLIYADGTPFFWLGDTIWRGNRASMAFAPDPDDAGPDIAEFPNYVANRQAKEFTVIQIVAGHPNDPDIVNEGGPTYLDPYTVINPVNFQWLDKRIQYIVDQRLVPVITGQWYMSVADMPLADLQRYWKYLVARYQAYNVIWIVTGEYGFLDDLEKVDQLGAYVAQIDALDHVTAVHPTPNDPFPAYSSAEHFAGAPWLDIHIQQTWDQAATRAAMVEDYGRVPVKPVINIEAGYDGLWGWNREMVRQDAWTVFMSGGAGYTYGANGIWNWNDGCCDNEKLEQPRWYEAIDLPSSEDMGRLVRFFRQTDWWALAPNDALASNGLVLTDGERELLVYLPDLPDYGVPVSEDTAVTVDLSQFSGNFNASWFNPRTGETVPDSPAAGGDVYTFTAPFPRDAVLRLWQE